MPMTGQGVAGRMRIAIVLVIAAALAQVCLDIASFVTLGSQIRLIGRFGWGHVPGEQLRSLTHFVEAASRVGVLLGATRLIAFGMFLFWAVEALDVLGIVHRFSRRLTAFSIVIPFVGLYLPWAALGEARQTFEAMERRQARLRETLRAFHFDSFVLGLVWVVGAVAVPVVAVIGVGSMGPDTWRAALSNAQMNALIVTSVDLVALLALSVYGIGFVNLYRRILPVAAIEVFAGPASAAEAPAYVPAGDPARS